MFVCMKNSPRSVLQHTQMLLNLVWGRIPVIMRPLQPQKVTWSAHTQRHRTLREKYFHRQSEQFRRIRPPRKFCHLVKHRYIFQDRRGSGSCAHNQMLLRMSLFFSSGHHMFWRLKNFFFSIVCIMKRPCLELGSRHFCPLRGGFRVTITSVLSQPLLG